MNIEDRIISITSYKCDIEGDKLLEIIDSSRYPKNMGSYTYGLIKTNKVGSRDIFTLAALLNSTRKEIIEKDGKFEIVDTASKTLSFGKIFFLKNEKIIGLVNSNNIISTVFKNLIDPYELTKIKISDDKYTKLYKNSLIITSCGLILKKPYKNYKMNISSETIEDQELTDILGKAEINSFSFNGRIFQEREISFRINKNGNVILYNSPKNPLDWEDIFNFMETNIYK